MAHDFSKQFYGGQTRCEGVMRQPSVDLAERDREKVQFSRRKSKVARR
jgi:hypothetical protein